MIYGVMLLIHASHGYLWLYMYDILTGIIFLFF